MINITLFGRIAVMANNVSGGFIVILTHTVIAQNTKIA
jgi:hypothetical protein